MSYEIISIVIMMVIFIAGGMKLKLAKKQLNETQSAIASQVILESKKGITQISLVLIIFFMIWLFLTNDLNHVFTFLFFFISFVLQIFYLLRLKKNLSLSDLPREYKGLTLKINVLFVVGLFIVVLGFMTNIF